MYLDHYHLKTKPFDLSPRPDFLWLGEKHEEALATLKYGIKEGLGFLLLTGDVGVGKTALIHRLINNLDSSTIVAHITDPGLGTLDFFKLLAIEFNIPIEFYSKGDFLIELEKFLYQAHSDHKKVLLIVDEAQRLNNKLLDQIRVLSNIELSDQKLINIFLVGQPEFKNMLLTNSNRAIRQRIAINYHIHPLTESETGQYIEYRLKVAGATRKIFKSNANREIFRFTGGYPRAINIICDHALMTGYASGIKSIDSDVIKECEQELNIRAGFEFKTTAFQTPTETIRPETLAPSPRRPAARRFPIFLGICIVLVAFASYYLLWPELSGTIKPNTQKEVAGASDHQTDRVVGEQAQASSKNDIALAQSDMENSTQDKAAPKDEIAAADGQPAVFTAQANPAPDPLPVYREVDSDVTVPWEAEKDLASLSAPSDAQPGVQTEKATQKAEIIKQDVPIASNQTTVADRQPAISDYQANPAPDPLPGYSEVDSDVTVPWEAEKIKQDVPIASNQTTVADRQPAISTDPAASATTPSSDNNTADSDVATPGKTGKSVALVAVIPDDAESDGKVRAASPPPTTAGASKKADSDNQKPTKKNTGPEKVSSGTAPVPPVTAKADTQLQPSSQPLGGNAQSVNNADKIGLENRLRSFLQNYCNTYAAKNLDAFTNLFIADARENGTPFIRLIPKYQKNFSFIETIQYRIELQQFSYDEDMGIVKMDGNFFLKWLPPDKKWRENAGKISMSLQEKGPSFLVRQLDYHSDRSKKE